MAILTAAQAGSGAWFGAHGLRADALARLTAWLTAQGARPIQPAMAGATATAAGCRVWAIGTPFGGLTPLGGEPAEAPGSGWLLGEIWQPAAARAAPGPWLAAALTRSGPTAAFGLVGQFALGWWNPSTRQLALYRDDTSACALYYTRPPGGGLLFGDRLDLLARCPLGQATIDPDGLAEYLRLFDISPPRTIWRGIRALEPGQLLEQDDQGWRLTLAPAPMPPAPIPQNLAAASEALETRLATAVRDRLHGAGDTALFLSGGVDSATLAALAAAEHPGRLVSVTVGFDDPAADESALAAAIADRLGLRHHPLRFDLDACRGAFDDLAVQAPFPFADPAAGVTLLAYRYTRGLAPVALDGTGADTLLGIMPARHQRLAIAWGARLPAALRRLLVRAMAALPGLRGYRPLLDFDDPPDVLARWHGFRRREIERLTGSPARLQDSRFYRLFHSFPRSAHFERYSALLGNLPDDRLHVAARLTGLQVRMPFFDPAVVALVRSLPRELRWCPDEPKRVLKAVLSRHLPRTLWDVPKHGFDAPFPALLAHRDHDLVRRLLAPDRVAATGLLDPVMVDELARRFIAGDRREAFRVWGLAVLLAWLDAH